MKDSTDITAVLDRSGSMSSVQDDTIGGFNSFLAEQKKVAGHATVSLVQFDNEYEPVYAGKNLADAPDLTRETFVPRGGTALLDAIGRTIVKTGERLAAMPESERPNKVVFVILTDGHENSSKEWDSAKVFAHISHQRDQFNWQFIFLGANQDAIATAAKIGIGSGSSLTFANSARGTTSALRATSSILSSYRTGKSASTQYSEADRTEQTEAGAKA